MLGWTGTPLSTALNTWLPRRGQTNPKCQGLSKEPLDHPFPKTQMGSHPPADLLVPGSKFCQQTNRGIVYSSNKCILSTKAADLIFVPWLTGRGLLIYGRCLCVRLCSM